MVMLSDGEHKNWIVNYRAAKSNGLNLITFRVLSLSPCPQEQTCYLFDTVVLGALLNEDDMYYSFIHSSVAE